MKNYPFNPYYWLALLVISFGLRLSAAPAVTDPQLSLRKVFTTGPNCFRLVRNPVDGALYYLKVNGELYRLHLATLPAVTTNELVATSAQHQVTSAAGMTIATDGTIFLTSNKVETNHTTGIVTQGILNSTTGQREWSVLAKTQPFPGGARIFNHQMNGIIVTPDQKSVLVNIGSRTDHGEVQDDGGLFPGVREVGVTTVLLKIPRTSSNLLLPEGREELRQQGYLFCEGLRNTYDLAYAGSGDLFGVENGPDRDMAEELNWLREGQHYGFPWRMGLDDNPQQFAAYDPTADRLLNPAYTATRVKAWHNDPTYPPPPTNFIDPIINLGPDADKFRDTVTGEVRDASDVGQTFGTFTSHRSPNGITIDSAGYLGSKYTGGAFVVSWTRGVKGTDKIEGPYDDPSEDLLHCALIPQGTNYQTRVTRIVGGFNYPIDVEQVGNRLYVLEWSWSLPIGIWEVTFPPGPVTLLSAPEWKPEDGFRLKLHGIPGLKYTLEASGTLLNWEVVTNYTAGDSPLSFVDSGSPQETQRFYRVRPEVSSPPARP